MLALLVLICAPDIAGVYADEHQQYAFTVVKVGESYVTQWTQWDGKDHCLWTYGIMRRSGPLAYSETYYYPDLSHKGQGELTYNPLDRTFRAYGFNMQRLP